MKIFVGVTFIILVIMVLVTIVNFGSNNYPRNFKVNQEEAAWGLFFKLILAVWAGVLLFG